MEHIFIKVVDLLLHEYFNNITICTGAGIKKFAADSKNRGKVEGKGSKELPSSKEIDNIASSQTLKTASSDREPVDINDAMNGWEVLYTK